MLKWLGIILRTLRSAVATRRELALENLALRQPLAVFNHHYPRPKLADTEHCRQRPSGFCLFSLSSAMRRRRIVHFNVTEHPTAGWTARQLVEVAGLEEVPRYLVRDRDAIYGERFGRQAAVLGIREMIIARQSPWQNPYAERVIGSIRRECLDHVVVLNERHLKRILSEYVDYYNGARTHLSLNKDAPDGRTVQPPEEGRVVEFKRVGGLHHHYVRLAA